MQTILQINVDANVGSTGKIAEQIGLLAEANGYESYMAYGRDNSNSKLKTIRIGNDFDVMRHGLETRLFDRHGLASRSATKRFVGQIKDLNPDIIHLHNIHGYYLNYPILFKYLNERGGPVVWTLHDCWPFTGHCAYFMMNGCEKWKSQCHDCPSLRQYPSSVMMDGSRRNYNLKKDYFSSIVSQLTLVPVSNYVANYIPDSILRNADLKVIHNGIDLNVFKLGWEEKKRIVLGVANVWNERKGLDDFFCLRKLLPPDLRIILVGLSENQIRKLPNGIEGISCTTNQHELASIYSDAMVLYNPTYEDNYPTVNLEAIACGTPVITYRTGGSPESISDETGLVFGQGDVHGVAKAIEAIDNGFMKFNPEVLREVAKVRFNKDDCFRSYLNLYDQLLAIQKQSN